MQATNAIDLTPPHNHSSEKPAVGGNPCNHISVHGVAQLQHSSC
jgi:hypothetical protein